MNKLFFNIIGFCMLLILSVKSVVYFSSFDSGISELGGAIVFFISMVCLYFWGRYILTDCPGKRDGESSEQD